jgi:SAM-dependent methyltransferase
MSQRRTEEAAYARRLDALQRAWWKRLLDVQRPYRWHVRRMGLGFVLDLGCGIGRNLVHLGGAAAGVGVDHNAEAVAIARQRGLVAFTPEEFVASAEASAGRFDSLLFAHVAEHMTPPEARHLLERYLPYVRAGGRAVLITPQEAGYRSDPTHVAFYDFVMLRGLARAIGLTPRAAYSFPLPRLAGGLFKYNEFVLIAEQPGKAGQ